jgi:hypothetical protein
MKAGAKVSPIIFPTPFFRPVRFGAKNSISSQRVWEFKILEAAHVP